MNTIVNSTGNQPIVTNFNSTQQAGGPSPDPKTGMGSLGNIKNQMIPNPGSQTITSAPVVLTDADLDTLEAALNASAFDDVGSFDYDQISSLIGALMLQNTASQREQALKQRLAGYEEAKNASLDQAGQLKEAAEKMNKGADISMAVGLATGSISMIGSGVSFAKQASAIKKSDNAMSAVDDASANLKNLKATGGTSDAIADAKQVLKSANAKSTGIDNSVNTYRTGADIATRMGDMGSRIGQGLDSKEQAKAKQDDAEASIDAAESTMAQQRADQAKEVQQARDDMIKTITNFIKEMRDSKIEMMKSITR